MDFSKVTLEALLAELGELPSDWLDAQAKELVGTIRTVTSELRASAQPISVDRLAELLAADRGFLDVCRLFFVPAIN